MALLSLDQQRLYREQYRDANPQWQSSEELYTEAVQQALTNAAYKSRIRVLDIGCGAGGVLEHVDIYESFLVGVDYDSNAFKRQRVTTLSGVAAPISALPFANQTFNIVLSSWTLEHLESPEDIFYEISRVLCPGGYFIFLTPNAHNIVTLINRSIPHNFQQRMVELIYGRAKHDTYPVYYRANTTRRLESLAANVGLTQHKLLSVSDPTYLAFTPWFFHISQLIERMTPPTNFVHIVGAYYKRA